MLKELENPRNAIAAIIDGEWNLRKEKLAVWEKNHYGLTEYLLWHAD